MRGIRWVPEDGHATEHGNSGLDDLEPFSAQLGVEVGEPGDVPARPSQVGNEPRAYRVSGDRHDDRDSRARFLRGHRRGCPQRDDDIDPERYQLRRETMKPLILSVCTPNLEGDALAPRVSQLAQSLKKCRPIILSR